MGGRLWVESEAGRGKHVPFHRQFPAGGDAPPWRQFLTRSICETGPSSIVDDNATNRRLLEEMLVGWRMVPTLAASAPEALAALRSAHQSGQPFQLVLTDFHMPDADGFTLADAIKTESGDSQAQPS